MRLIFLLRVTTPKLLLYSKFWSIYSVTLLQNEKFYEKMRLQVIFKPRTDDGEDAKIKIVMPFFGNTTVAQFVAGAVQRYE